MLTSPNGDNVSVVMDQLEQRMRSKRPKPRGRKQALAPYADQLRRYVEDGWTRKEIVAEMRALGLPVSTATLRDVLGMTAPKRRPNSRRPPNQSPPEPAPGPARYPI